uniref:DELTA-thalatoxin-Avl1b-like n=1 Tax=Xenopus tropicalis TaxID=8364 RepID=A0A803KFK7_XENTR
METSMDKLLSKVDSEKCVGIEISNKSSSIILSCPRTYCANGSLHYPPSPTVSPGTVEHCIFVKTPSIDTGTIGVLTYKFPETYSIAILFSNRYYYTLDSIHFGLWFLDGTGIPISKIYEDMKDKIAKNVSNDCFDHCVIGNEARTLRVWHRHVKVLATMSYTTKAILRVEILDNTVAESEN